MSHSLKILLGILIGLFLLGAIWSSYVLFIQETNDYSGYVGVSYDLPQIVFLLLISVYFGFVVSNKTRRPSDLFIHIYLIVVLMPFAVLAGVRAEIEIQTYLLAFAILGFPLGLLKLLQCIRADFQFRALISERLALLLLISVAIWGVILLFRGGIDSASFDIYSSYDRRLQGREQFQTGALSSYLLSIVCNGIIPTLAFFAGLRRQWLIFIASAVGGLLFYFFLGLKAPILFSVIGLLFGALIRRGCVAYAGRLLIALVFLSFVCFFIEFLIQDYSVVGDYLLRRAFAVPPFLISVYMDIIVKSSGLWGLWAGVDTNLPVTMFVGDYLGDPTLNANTNTFVYALAGGGLGLYIFHAFLTMFVLRVIDYLYAGSANNVWFWIALIFSLLVVEQSVTTVLVSSGIGTLVAVFAFSAASKTNEGKYEN